MDLGLSFAKYVLFFFNFLFVVLGIAMVSMGIIVITKFVEYHDFVEYDLTPYPIILIFVGCVVFLIAYLGCCGAIKENSCMLCLYAITMIVIVVFEAGFIYAAYSKKADMESIVDNRLNYTLHKAVNNSAYMETWHLMQTEFKCCGIMGPNDWNNVLPQPDVLPGSCCQKAIDDTTCHKSEAVQIGCKTIFIDYLNGHILTVAGIAIGVAIVQMLGIIFPCCLFSAFRRDQRLPRRWGRH